MDLWRLNIYCKVVEHRSFTKAAELTYLSQPTVSGHIKYLENYFGCKLIDRLGREAVPTKAGEILYAHALKLIALKEETETALARFQGDMKGRLLIGGSTIPGSYILPSLMGKFRKEYPKIKITLVLGDTEKITKEVLDGRIEVGMVGAKTRDKQISYAQFIEDELVLVLPASHRWAKRSSIAVTELAKEPFIMRERGSGTRKSIEDVLKKRGLSLGLLNVVAEMGSTESVCQGIKAGVGLSILSKKVVSEDMAGGRLKGISIEGLVLKRNFYLITNKGRTKSPLCEVFIKFIKKQLTTARAAAT
jgi:DNA-binding transcriptional LysR family regulator